MSLDAGYRRIAPVPPDVRRGNERYTWVVNPIHDVDLNVRKPFQLHGDRANRERALTHLNRMTVTNYAILPAPQRRMSPEGISLCSPEPMDGHL